MDPERIYQVVRYSDRFPVGRVREVVRNKLSLMEANKLAAQLDVGLKSEQVAVEVDKDIIEKLKVNQES